jgi:DNA-binding IclR family transcriptional regulator
MKVHSTSVGKSLVAWLPADEVFAILERHGMERRTPKTIVTARRFISELLRVRDNGFAVDDEENNPGARCVGVPVFDAPNHVAAALGLSGTSSQVTRDNVTKLAEVLREAARRISHQLGFEAPRR